MIQLGLKRGIFALGGLMFVATAGLLLPRDGSETAVPVIQRATTATAATEEQAVTPIPLSVAVDARKLALGRRLFNDPRLSHDNSVACASCHQLASGGADGAPHSTGIGGRQGARNAPTDRKSTRLNSSHRLTSRMPSSA
jgi:cytochrome c peroxidase